jgi:hypothetical protein
MGCGTQKLSVEDIVSRLNSNGYTVSQEGRIHNSLEGAQSAFWLNIDGKRISAYQYSTVDKARLKYRSFQNGLCVGYWAFEFVDEKTAEKIKSALK